MGAINKIGLSAFLSLLILSAESNAKEIRFNPAVLNPDQAKALIQDKIKAKGIILDDYVLSGLSYSYGYRNWIFMYEAKNAEKTLLINMNDKEPCDYTIDEI